MSESKSQLLLRVQAELLTALNENDDAGLRRHVDEMCARLVSEAKAAKLTETWNIFAVPPCGES